MTEEPCRLILRGRAVTGSGTVEDAAVTVDGSVLAYAGPAGTFAARDGDTVIPLADGETVIPGLIDLHCHGGHGVDFSGAGMPELRRGISALHASGTTTLLASLVAGDPAVLTRQLALGADLTEEGLLAGTHLEGPFLSEARCGAQDPRWLRKPDPDLVRELAKSARGTLKTMTYAPELPGAADLVRQLAGLGVLPSLGHTAATADQAAESLALARRELAASFGYPARPTVTHLFNAMDPLHHRAPGAVSACLRAAKSGGAVVELIADNIHLDPQLVLTMFDLLGADNIALVTDSMAAAGLGDGEYRLGPAEVTVRDGTARLASTGAIAGGTASMLGLLRNAVRAGVPLADAVTAAAGVPARVLGLDSGQLVQGTAADLLVLGPDLELRRVMRRGAWLPGSNTGG